MMDAGSRLKQSGSAESEHYEISESVSCMAKRYLLSICVLKKI